MQAAMTSVLGEGTDNLVASTHDRLGGILEQINGKPAQQLGEKVSRLLRQHLTAKGNVANLLHANWIHQKRDVGAPVNLVDRLLRFAHVLQVLLIADVFFRHLQSLFQHKLMELDNVKLSLPLRLSVQSLRLLTWQCAKKVGGISRDGEQCCAICARFS